MALKLDTDYKGLSIHGANVTVVMPRISVGKSEMTFVLWYRTSEFAEPFKAEEHSAPYEVAGGDPFSQAYIFLKTLPEFAESQDC